MGVLTVTSEEAFGIVLRQHRLRLSLSQEELAIRSNVDRTFISHIERGKHQPTITTIFKLAQQLNLTPSQMIREAEDLLAKATK